jgi:hypothetical protein
MTAVYNTRPGSIVRTFNRKRIVMGTAAHYFTIGYRRDSDAQPNAAASVRDVLRSVHSPTAIHGALIALNYEKIN